MRRGIVRDKDRSAVHVVAVRRVGCVQRHPQRDQRRQEGRCDGSCPRAEPDHARLTSGRTAAIAMSARPNVQTIVAPVGKSNWTEKYIPSIETSTPMTQPIASLGPMREEKSIPPTD